MKKRTLKLNSVLLAILIAAACFCSACAHSETDDADMGQAAGKETSPVYTVQFYVGDSVQGYLAGETEQQVAAGQQTEEVTAYANAGYRFLNWSNGETTPTITFTPTDDTDVYALFILEELSLPVMQIATKDAEEILSKEEYLSCTVTVTNAEQDNFNLKTAKIRGRGSTSWEMPKKSYKLRFTAKTDLFGNGSARNWTLIANYSDKSLLRNFLAYSVGAQFSALSETTSKTQFVELYVNGGYLGVYLVAEQNETGETRVNISESLESTDTGYLLEMEYGTEEENAVTVGGMDYILKTPDADDVLEAGKDIAEYQTFIRNYLQSCLDALDYCDWESVTALIDVTSFAQSYVVNELFKSVDVGQRSFYLYKDAGGKLFSGPIWDYDVSCGNCDYVDTETYDTTVLYAAENNAWYANLLKYEQFRALVRETLETYSGIITETIDNCLGYAYSCSDSFLRNFERWDILGTYVWPNTEEIAAIDTWEGQTEYLRAWLYESLDFLTATYCL